MALKYRTARRWMFTKTDSGSPCLKWNFQRGGHVPVSGYELSQKSPGYNDSHTTAGWPPIILSCTVTRSSCTSTKSGHGAVELSPFLQEQAYAGYHAVSVNGIAEKA
jgi:hypothetical protein